MLNTLPASMLAADNEVLLLSACLSFRNMILYRMSLRHFISRAVRWHWQRARMTPMSALPRIILNLAPHVWYGLCDMNQYRNAKVGSHRLIGSGGATQALTSVARLCRRHVGATLSQYPATT